MTPRRTPIDTGLAIRDGLSATIPADQRRDHQQGRNTMHRLKRRFGAIGLALAVIGASVALAACAPAASHCEWSGASVPGDNTTTQDTGNGGSADVTIAPGSHVTYDGVYTSPGTYGYGAVRTMTINGTAPFACITHWATSAIRLSQPSFVVRDTALSGATLDAANGTTGTDSRWFHDSILGFGFGDPLAGECIHTNTTGTTSVEESFLSCGSGVFAFNGNLGTASGQGWDIEQSHVAAGGFFTNASTQAGLLNGNFFDATCPYDAADPNCGTWLSYVAANHGFDPPGSTSSTYCQNNVVAWKYGAVPAVVKSAWNAKCGSTTFVGASGRTAALNTWKSGRMWYPDASGNAAMWLDPAFARGQFA